jgi:hypothetical protein
MKQKDVVREVCAIVALAFHSINNYDEPSDGFCDKCPNSGTNYFQHSGRTVDCAVLDALKRDGHKIADGFDPETGREVPHE